MTPEYRKAIQSIESSGGNYSLLGPVTKNGDRAYGAYQVMGNNIPEWTQKHLGRAYSPEEFLADKEAQDKVFDSQFGSYVDKYGNPQDAASAWFTGGPLSSGANKRDVLGTSGSVYVDKFNKALGQGGDGVSAINSAAGIKPAPGLGALTSAFAGGSGAGGDTGALSANNVLGGGILGSSGGPDRIAEGLTTMGASLAGISSPAQAQALNQQLVAMRKAPADAGNWSIHTMPNGKVVKINNKTAQVVEMPGTYAKPEEDEYAKAFKTGNAKDMVELNSGLSSSARDSLAQQGSVEELRRAFDDPNVKQGIDGPFQQMAKKAYVAMGFGDADMAAAAAKGDIASALSNKLALQLVNSGGVKLLPGSFSDSDRKFVTQMSTSLSNEPEANRRLLDIYSRANARVQEAEQLRQSHAQANGGILLPGFRAELNSLSTKWAEEDKAREAATAQSPAPGKKSVTLPKGVKSIQMIQQ